jgi:hypothetical protein
MSSYWRVIYRHNIMMNLYHKFTVTAQKLIVYLVNVSGWQHYGGNFAAPELSGITLGMVGISGNLEGTRITTHGANLYGSRTYNYNLSTPWDMTTATVHSIRATTFNGQGVYGLSYANNGSYIYSVHGDGYIRRSNAVDYRINNGHPPAGQVVLTGYGSGHIKSVFVPNEGGKLYMLSAWNIRQFSMNEFDLGTLTHVRNKSINVEGNWPSGLNFTPDGLHFYYSGRGGSADFEWWTLSTPWDVSTATFSGSKSFSQMNPEDVHIGFELGKAITAESVSGFDLFRYVE